MEDKILDILEKEGVSLSVPEIESMLNIDTVDGLKELLKWVSARGQYIREALLTRQLPPQGTALPRQNPENYPQ